MKAQKPAQGILLHRNYGDAVMYEVTCDCSDADHKHAVWIEADDTGVTVTTYTTQKVDWWSTPIESYNVKIENPILDWGDQFLRRLINGLWTRCRLTWTLWHKGYVKYEASIIMNEQQALNYAETLKSAVKEVKDFKEKSYGKSKEDSQ